VNVLMVKFLAPGIGLADLDRFRQCLSQPKPLIDMDQET
jgi:hypothetical protein